MSMRPEDYEAGSGQVEPIPERPPVDELEEREAYHWARMVNSIAAGGLILLPQAEGRGR